jgi:cytochrome c biogenesis protein CcmG/thiol:disulfide interchange protein DsbE
MNFTQDALRLGPLAIEWGRLGLLAGLFAFLLLAGRAGRRVEGAAWLVVGASLVVGRLAYALRDPANFALAPNGWLSLLDPRYGSVSLLWAAAAAVLGALIALRSRAVALAAPATVALLLGFGLPLLRPAAAAQAPASTIPVLVLGSEPTTWGELPRPALVNFWATWCPPCREEMPLLAEYAAKGAPIVFMNDQESPEIIRDFLSTSRLGIATVHIATPTLDDALGVSALPTTVAVDSQGNIIARHLGPFDRVGLEDMLDFIEGK